MLRGVLCILETSMGYRTCFMSQRLLWDVGNIVSILALACLISHACSSRYAFLCSCSLEHIFKSIFLSIRAQACIYSYVHTCSSIFPNPILCLCLLKHVFIHMLMLAWSYVLTSFLSLCLLKTYLQNSISMITQAHFKIYFIVHAHSNMFSNSFLGVCLHKHIFPWHFFYSYLLKDVFIIVFMLIEHISHLIFLFMLAQICIPSYVCACLSIYWNSFFCLMLTQASLQIHFYTCLSMFPNFD